MGQPLLLTDPTAEGAENLSNLLVFVDHAASTVSWSNAEVVESDYAIG